jgi:hypothetical protein
MLLDTSRTVAEDLLQPSKNIEMKGEIFRFVKLNTSYDDEKWLDFRREFLNSIPWGKGLTYI